MLTWLRALGAVVLLSAALLSQSPAPEQPIRTLKDLDTFLSKPLSDKDLLRARAYALQECNSQNMSLRQELDSYHQREGGIFAASFGLGLGLVAAFAALRYLMRVWSLSTVGKQFVVMMAAAIWVTTVVFLEASSKTLVGRPLSVLLSVVVYSIPAIIFSGVFLWWLRSSPMQADLQS